MIKSNQKLNEESKLCIIDAIRIKTAIKPKI